VSTLEPLLQNLVGQRDSKFEASEKELCARRPVVLCVDDDHNILDLEKEILESQGFQVVCMTDPQQAIRELKTLGPDVAVIDYSMPHMSGTELCHRLRQVGGYHSLGVLMLSGTEHTEIIDKALQHGIADYLCKPIDIGELVARVKLLTQLRILSREKKSNPQRD
jgi:DNA-binding response OmpR family regulator